MSEVVRKPRNLSGVYFRYQNPENGRWENWCFEDLPLEYREEMMKSRDVEWLKSLANHLANCLVRVGDELDLQVK